MTLTYKWVALKLNGLLLLRLFLESNKSVCATSGFLFKAFAVRITKKLGELRLAAFQREKNTGNFHVNKFVLKICHKQEL